MNGDTDTRRDGFMQRLALAGVVAGVLAVPCDVASRCAVAQAVAGAAQLRRLVSGVSWTRSEVVFRASTIPLRVAGGDGGDKVVARLLRCAIASEKSRALHQLPRGQHS